MHSSNVKKLLTDFIAVPTCQEDNIHNMQAVIDSLALDYLQISLSHITGEYNKKNCCKNVPYFCDTRWLKIAICLKLIYIWSYFGPMEIYFKLDAALSKFAIRRFLDTFYGILFFFCLKVSSSKDLWQLLSSLPQSTCSQIVLENQWNKIKFAVYLKVSFREGCFQVGGNINLLYRF